MQPVNIFWFRRDLRLEDNHGLYRALSAGLPVLPIFIFDKKILSELQDPGDRRIAFICQSIQKIKDKLREFNSDIHVCHGNPVEVFQDILKKWRVNSVFTNHDYEPYAVNRDKEVQALLSQHGADLFTFKDQVIFEKSEIIKKDQKPYTRYTPYAHAWKLAFSNQGSAHYPSLELLEHCIKIPAQPLPTTSSLGFDIPDHWKFEPVNLSTDFLHSYESTRNDLSMSTSRISVHLRFGTVSIRHLVALAAQHSAGFLSELIWREFFMMILWHFPQVVTQCFTPKYEHLNWQNDPENFQKWCDGSTGYPLVDAGLRELNETGFMHNRVRMVTASFLTKHLLIDWRWGEAYFAKKLTDYDLASNNGNWQWCAGCGCDAAPYFRIFNPVTQAEKFDPDRTYIKRWVQTESNYPLPIIDHHDARQKALAFYAEVLNK